MKNITKQYQDLLEGKISKANFMTNVRRLFPDYIGTTNSFQDAVSILKSKRILSEGEVQNLTKDKMYYLVDERGDVVDQVEASDMIAARNHFENEFEGLMTSMTVVPSHPQAMYEAVGGKNFMYKGEDGKDKFVTADNIDQAKEKVVKFGADPKTVKEKTASLPVAPKASNEAVDAELEAAKEEARKNSQEGYVQHVNKKGHGYVVEDWYDADSTVASYENGEQINEAKKSLNEAEEKSEGSYKKVTGKEQYEVFNEIDRVNPYELRKGITIEMGMQYLPTPNYFTTHFNPDTLAKATKKVLKNLQKDPAYYTNNTSLEFEKKSGLLQKPKELKVGADGEAKVKGFADAKSNTETNLGKKEKGTKSPEGVKEMKPSKKSMGGIKIMKSNEKLPKGVDLMKEEEVKNIASTIFDLNKVDVQSSNKLPEQTKGMESRNTSKQDKIAKLKEYLKTEVRKALKEEDPALTKLEKDEENAERALATVLTKKAAILNKPGTQG